MTVKFLANDFDENTKHGIAIVRQDSSYRTIHVQNYDETDYEAETTRLVNWFGKETKLKEIIEEDVPNTFHLKFPHVIFVIFYAKQAFKYYLGDLNCFFSTTKTNSKFYLPPLTNVYPSGNVCLGNSIFNNGFKTLDDLTLGLVENFWATEFNFDVPESIECYQDHGKKIADYHYWAYKSKNPKWTPKATDLIEISAETLAANGFNDIEVQEFQKIKRLVNDNKNSS